MSCNTATGAGQEKHILWQSVRSERAIHLQASHLSPAVSEEHAAPRPRC